MGPGPSKIDRWGLRWDSYRPFNVSRDNVTPQLWGTGQVQSYYQPAWWYDPAKGCNKSFVGTYTCGKGLPKNVTMNNFNGSSVATFDCRTEHDACIAFRFEVTDTGMLRFTDKNGNLLKQFYETNVETNESVNIGQRREDIYKINKMVLDGRLPPEFKLRLTYVKYMYPSQALKAGEYICSSTGNCFFALDETDGMFKLFTIKIRSGPAGGTTVVTGMNDVAGSSTKKSAALYELRGVSVDNMDRLANISIDGKQRAFGLLQRELGEKYVEITAKDVIGRNVTYDNPENDLEEVDNDTRDIEYCFNQCSIRPNCGGFVVSEGKPDKCYLKDTNMFPVGNRVKNPDTKLYKRLYKPKGVSSSCMRAENAQVVAIDSVLLDHYPKVGGMSRNTLCGVDQLVEAPTASLNRIESGALADFLSTMGAKIEKAIDKLTYYNTVESDPQMNVNHRINRYDNVNTEIKSILKKQDVISGVEEDTHLQVISETYKYIIWSIVAIIVVIVIVTYGDISNYATNMSGSFGKLFTSSSSSTAEAGD
jgi:hypothetical protein